MKNAPSDRYCKLCQGKMELLSRQRSEDASRIVFVDQCRTCKSILFREPEVKCSETQKDSVENCDAPLLFYGKITLFIEKLKGVLGFNTTKLARNQRELKQLIKSLETESQEKKSLLYFDASEFFENYSEQGFSRFSASLDKYDYVLMSSEKESLKDNLEKKVKCLAPSLEGLELFFASRGYFFQTIQNHDAIITLFNRSSQKRDHSLSWPSDNEALALVDDYLLSREQNKETLIARLDIAIKRKDYKFADEISETLENQFDPKLVNLRDARKANAKEKDDYLKKYTSILGRFHYFRGIIFADHKRFEEALDSFSVANYLLELEERYDIISRKNDWPIRALYMQAKTLRTMQRRHEALKLFEFIEERREDLGVSLMREVLNERAEIFLEIGDYYSAYSLLSELFWLSSESETSDFSRDIAKRLGTTLGSALLSISEDIHKVDQKISGFGGRLNRIEQLLGTLVDQQSSRVVGRRRSSDPEGSTDKIW